MGVFESLPIWAVYLLTVVLVLLSAEAGFRIGLNATRRDPSGKAPSSRGALTGSLLGLVAFLLAFTIGIVINQHNSRREMVVMETNSVGTAWLRAGLLDEPAQSSARALLLEYGETRLAATTGGMEQFDAAIARSEEIHGELWAIVEETVRQGNDSPAIALFIAAINDVIDVHLLRLTAATIRLPSLLVLVLYAASMVSFLLLGVGSSSDGKRDTMTMLLFAAAFVAVLAIIVDLNRPQEGLLNISQQAMEDLVEQMKAAAP